MLGHALSCNLGKASKGTGDGSRAWFGGVVALLKFWYIISNYILFMLQITLSVRCFSFVLFFLCYFILKIISVHPLSSAYPIQGRGLESTRAVIKQEAEYTLHQKPVFQGENSEEDNHSNSWPILESPINLTSMSLACGRTPEWLERTMQAQGECAKSPQKGLNQLKLKPRTFLL